MGDTAIVLGVIIFIIICLFAFFTVAFNTSRQEQLYVPIDMTPEAVEVLKAHHRRDPPSSHAIPLW